MSTELIRWTDASDRGFFGFAGRYGPAAFKVIPPGPGEDFWMLSNYMCPLGTSRFGATAAEMKRQAETWLREFASSLGAVFTADLREQMEGLASGFQDLASALAGSDGEQDWREACDHAGRAAAYAHVIELLDAKEAR